MAHTASDYMSCCAHLTLLGPRDDHGAPLGARGRQARARGVVRGVGCAGCPRPLTHAHTHGQQLSGAQQPRWLVAERAHAQRCPTEEGGREGVWATVDPSVITRAAVPFDTMLGHCRARVSQQCWWWQTAPWGARPHRPAREGGMGEGGGGAGRLPTPSPSRLINTAIPPTHTKLPPNPTARGWQQARSSPGGSCRRARPRCPSAWGGGRGGRGEGLLNGLLRSLHHQAAGKVGEGEGGGGCGATSGHGWGQSLSG